MTTITPRTLHVTSPLTRGPDVLEIQRRLDELGYAVGALDGAYGVATASAVRAFQRDQGLTVDGIVGPQTRRAIAHADLDNVPTQDPSATGLRALARGPAGTSGSRRARPTPTARPSAAGSASTA